MLGNILQCKYRTAYVLLGLWMVIAGTYLHANGWNQDEWGWFIEAAKRIVDGSLAIYEYVAAEWAAPPRGIGYAYPPLYALLAAPSVVMATRLGWSDAQAAMLLVAFLLATSALALYASSALVRWLHRDRSELIILVGLIWLLIFGKLFEITAHIAHQEGLMLLFLVLGLRLLPERPLGAGVALGLTFQAKQTMVLALIPLAGILLREALRCSEGRRLAWRTGLGFVLAAIPLLVIFYIAHPDQMRYVLLTAESRRVLYGPTNWAYVNTWLQQLRPDSYDQPHPVLLAVANPVLLLVTVGVTAFLLWRRPVGLHTPPMYALVALGPLLQIALGKWVEYHYFTLPLALLLLWELRLNPRVLPWFSMSLMLGIFALYVEPHRFFHGVAVQSLILLALVVLVAHVWYSPPTRLDRASP